MRWLNKMLWWVVIISLSSDGKILNKLMLDNHQPSWNKMSELMKLCFSEHTNPIIITKDLVDAIFRTTRDIDRPNLNVIDHNYKAKQIQIFNPAYPTYILSANSSNQLKDLLYALKSSPTWSSNSVFFIVEANKESCANASKMLQILWEMNLISSFYVCYESDNKEIMMLYTYNPFTDRAPESWVEVKSTDKPDDRWTLYRQPYTNSKEVCESLTYDKTKSLDGYKVKAVTKSFANYTSFRNYGIDSSEQHSRIYQQVMIAQNLFTALNVTPVIHQDKPGYWVNNTASGFLVKLMNGSYDMSIDFRKLEHVPNIEWLNLHYQISYMISTQRKSIVRSTPSIGTFLDRKIIGVSILILVVTFIIIVIYNGRDYSSGFLDIIQLCIGGGIDAPLDKLPVRVIFLVTTLFIFIISPEIQGRIFSDSTQSERQYPQGFQDLKDFKFNLYYPFHLKDFIYEQASIYNFNETYLREFSRHPLACTDKVLNDSSNACLDPQSIQFEAIYHLRNLHLAQKILSSSNLVFWAKRDWVLKDKTEKIALRFSEMGLFDKWDRHQSNYALKRLKAREIIENSGAEYDEITFESLMPSYLFIFLCFILGILIFVAEIAIVKCKEVQRRRKIIRTLEKRVKYVGGRIILIK